MNDSMVKLRTNKLSNSYAAIKSQNEIYYQMASILKQVSNTEEKSANIILDRIFSRKIKEKLLVN